MTLYEVARRGIEPFLPPLYKKVRKQILKEVSARQETLSILDVGGRKSPYTIGIPAKITIIDLPRESDTQKSLNLGINDRIADQLKTNRSNIENLLIGDMTCSGLPDESYDIITAVEVLEHVEEDELFVSEVARVLKPGGKFIMTTPNGDFAKIPFKDHKRHYALEQLSALLSKYFEKADVEYAIVGGAYRSMGLRPWSLKHPVQTVSSAFGNVINSVQSSRPEIRSDANATRHLFAVGHKR